MRRFRIETGGSGTGGGFVGGGSGGDTKPVDEQPPAHDSSFPSNAKSGDTHTIKNQNGSQVTYRLDCGGNGTGCSWVPISAVLPEAVVKADRVTYSQLPINPINNQLVFGGDELVYIYIDKTWYGTQQSPLPANVKNETKNDCIAKLLLWLANQQNSNLFGGILKNTFGKNSKAALFFNTIASYKKNYNEDLIGNFTQGDNGHTYSSTQTRIDIVISDLLVNAPATQEFMLKTIAHELVHAYMDYEINVNKNTTFPKEEEAQHEYMAKNYVSEIANIIRAYNPNFTAEEATALAWSGLEQTTEYQTKVKDAGKDASVKLIQIKERNDLTKNQFKGSLCK